VDFKLYFLLHRQAGGVPGAIPTLLAAPSSIVAQRVLCCIRTNFPCNTTKLMPLHVGKPVAYKLVPGAIPTLLASPSSMIAQRGGFAQKNLWVTPHSDAERFPSSEQITVMFTFRCWISKKKKYSAEEPVSHAAQRR